jgi:hypothetical protein
MRQYNVNKNTRNVALDTNWIILADGETLMLQSTGTFYLLYGDGTTEYYTFPASSEAILVIGGCRVRAASSCTLTVTGFNS